MTAALSVLIISAGTSSLYAQKFVSAARIAKPSVVYVAVYQTDSRDGKKNYTKTGYGSGTIVSDDGYVLTNFHVVNKGNFYQITLSDGTECDVERMTNGEFYLADEGIDLAVLKIKNSERRQFKAAVFGDSGSLSEGDWVIAIGNPYGLRHSVTGGIVSSVGRSDIGFAEIEDFIQTDVPINPGNSGGPLVNEQGEIVGINTAIRTVSGGYQGISFAIPSKLAEKVFRELLSYGHVRRGWLGVIVKEDRRSTDSDLSDLRVISVIKNSPAGDVGIEEGDILRQVDGVTVSSQGKLMRFVKNKAVGSQLRLTVSRDGKLHDYMIVLREKAIYKKVSKAISSLMDSYGIELSEDRTTGLLVVTYLSPLRMTTHGNQIRQGDILLSINGAHLKGMDEFARIYSKWEYSISKATVSRNGRIYVIDFEMRD
jgi:serine protease Do